MGNPCDSKTWFNNSSAVSFAQQSLGSGSKWVNLENLSYERRNSQQLWELQSYLGKWVVQWPGDMCDQGWVRTGSGCIVPGVTWPEALFCLHTWQVAMYSGTCLIKDCHQNHHQIKKTVLLTPGWHKKEVEWAQWITVEQSSRQLGEQPVGMVRLACAHFTHFSTSNCRAPTI